MKRKNIIMYIVAVAVVLAGVGIVFRPKALGNMNHCWKF